MARASGTADAGRSGRKDRSAVLAELRARVRRMEGIGTEAGGVLPLGLDAVDSHLPDGGLPLACLHEIVDGGDGAGTGFAAALLARVEGPVLWLTRAGDLYAPGLAAFGLAPERLLLLTSRRDPDLLWAMEEGLRAQALAAVLGEIEHLPPVAARRLQLAAETGRTTALLLRGPAVVPAVNAVTRWRASPLPTDPAGEPGVGPTRWRLELERCRGGSPAEWTVEWDAGDWHARTPAALSAAGRRAHG